MLLLVYIVSLVGKVGHKKHKYAQCILNYMQKPITKVISRYEELNETKKRALIFINEFSDKELNLSRLSRYLSIELSSTSKVLKELRNCGLIRTKRNGKELSIETSTVGRELVEDLQEKKDGTALVMFL